MGDKRIFVVEDHGVVRDGIVMLLERQPGWKVCGQAGNLRQASEFLAREQPDLVLLDLMIEGSDGLRFIKELRSLYTPLRVLVLSMHSEMIYAERALNAGAAGYIMKLEPAETLLQAIRTVLAGGIYASARVARHMVTRSPLDNQFSKRFAALSDRELHIFHLIGRGLQPREIADQLHLSVRTVEAHRENIKNKLSIQTASELLKTAMLWLQETDRADSSRDASS